MRPKIQTKEAAGADLHASENVPIPTGESAVVSTGYLYDVPGCTFMKGRSGLAFKHNVVAFEGTIDADFIGNEVKVKLFNLGKKNILIVKGDRIAQLVVVDTKTHEYFETEDKERDGGFSSTGR